MSLQWNDNKTIPIKLLLYKSQFQQLIISKHVKKKINHSRFKFRNKNVKIYRIKCNVSQLIKELLEKNFKFYYLLPIHNYPTPRNNYPTPRNIRRINWNYYNAVEYQDNISTYTESPKTNILTYNISHEIFENTIPDNLQRINLQKSRIGVFNNIFNNNIIFNLISLQEVSFEEQDDLNIIYDWDNVHLFKKETAVFDSYTGLDMNKIKDKYNIIINKIKKKNKRSIVSGMIILYDKKLFKIELLNNIPLVFNLNYEPFDPSDTSIDYIGQPIQMVFFTCQLIYINVHDPKFNRRNRGNRRNHGNLGNRRNHGNLGNYGFNRGVPLMRSIKRYIESFGELYGPDGKDIIFSKMKTYKIIINGDFNRDISATKFNLEQYFGGDDLYIWNRTIKTCCTKIIGGRFTSIFDNIVTLRINNTESAVKLPDEYDTHVYDRYQSLSGIIPSYHKFYYIQGLQI